MGDRGPMVNGRGFIASVRFRDRRCVVLFGLIQGEIFPMEHVNRGLQRRDNELADGRRWGRRGSRS
jgi:hypothetical protein